MGFFDNLFSKSKDGNLLTGTDPFQNCDFEFQDLSYRRLAIEIAVDLIANSVARVDWKEFVKGDSSKRTNATYLLNYSPNNKQTSSEFFKEYVRTLLLDNEVLIIPRNGSLYIADEFTKKETGLDNIIFSNIIVDEYKLQGTKRLQEVIYLKLSNARIKALIDAYMVQFEKILGSAEEGYKQNKVRRFAISSSQFRAQLTEQQKAFNDMMTEQLATFLSASGKSAVYAKANDWTLDDYSDKQAILATDTRNLLDDIFKTIGFAFHIPYEMLVTGDISQNKIDNYLLHAVYPLVDLFKEGFNQYNYSKTEIQNGTEIKADLTKVRLTDLKTIGTFIAQVFPTGALSLNDVVVNYLQGDALPPEIGDIRVITKNYQNIDSFNNPSEQPFSPEIEQAEN